LSVEGNTKSQVSKASCDDLNLHFYQVGCMQRLCS